MVAVERRRKICFCSERMRHAKDVIKKEKKYRFFECEFSADVWLKKKEKILTDNDIFISSTTGTKHNNNKTL